MLAARLIFINPATQQPTGRIALYFNGKIIEPAVNLPDPAVGWVDLHVTDELVNRWNGKVLTDLAALKALAVS